MPHSVLKSPAQSAAAAAARHSPPRESRAALRLRRGEQPEPRRKASEEEKQHCRDGACRKKQWGKALRTAAFAKAQEHEQPCEHRRGKGGDVEHGHRAPEHAGVGVEYHRYQRRAQKSGAERRGSGGGTLAAEKEPRGGGKTTARHSPRRKSRAELRLRRGEQPEPRREAGKEEKQRRHGGAYRKKQREEALRAAAFAKAEERIQSDEHRRGKGENIEHGHRAPEHAGVGVEYHRYQRRAQKSGAERRGSGGGTPAAEEKPRGGAKATARRTARAAAGSR